MNPPSLEPEITITLPGGIPMVFRRIVDAGETAEFWRGSRGGYADEEPRHRVRLQQPFYLGVTPVTQAQYRAMAVPCLAELQRLDGNKGADPSHLKGDDRPVEQVDFQDAEVVAGWLSASGLLQAAGLAKTAQACLPTEAQWEYACRAGTETEYWSGDGAAALAEVGWYEGNAGGGTHPVGEKPANAFGLHDMHGNVWEWCRDAWDAAAYRPCPDGVIDPWVRRDEKSGRVLRGGSWRSSAGGCRSAFRDWLGAGLRDWGDGFRLCLLPGPVAAQPGKKRSGALTGGGRRGTSRTPEVGGGAGIDLSAERGPKPQRPA